MRFVYEDLYCKHLPGFFWLSTSLGFGIGTLLVCSSNKPFHPLALFMTIVGYTGIGMIIGITYPVSYPLMGGVVWYHSRPFIE